MFWFIKRDICWWIVWFWNKSCFVKRIIFIGIYVYFILIFIFWIRIIYFCLRIIKLFWYVFFVVVINIFVVNSFRSFIIVICFVFSECMFINIYIEVNGIILVWMIWSVLEGIRWIRIKVFCYILSFRKNGFFLIRIRSIFWIEFYWGVLVCI